MADFQLLTPELASSVTTTNVLMAETATAGMVITSDGSKADCTDANKLDVAGILLEDATSGKYGVVARPSTKLDVTPALTKGGVLILGTAGLVQYADEIVATENLVIVAFCTLTTQLEVFIKKAGILV